MAIVNTFLCNCGATVGRPANVAPLKKDSPRYGVVAWHARPQDAVLQGIRCSCGQWWRYVKPKKHIAYADITKWHCEKHDYMWRCDC